MPRHSLVPHHLSMTTDKPPSSFMQEPELRAEELPSTENTSHEALLATEGPEGPSLTHRTFVPMPPICSNSTVHSEAVSHPSRTAGLLSPDHPSDDDDAKSTESIFLTQVLVPSCLHLWLQCPQVPAPSHLHCTLWSGASQDTSSPVAQTAPRISLGCGAGQLAEACHYCTFAKVTSLPMLPWVLGTKVAQIQVPSSRCLWSKRKAERNRTCHLC